MRARNFLFGVFATLIVVLIYDWTTDSTAAAEWPVLREDQSASILGRPEGGVLSAPTGGTLAAPATRAAAEVAAATDRVSIESIEDIERRLSEAIERDLVERLIADLPPDWVTPISDKASGSGPQLGGLPHGEWELYYAETGKTAKGRFMLGAQHGAWKTYNEREELIQVRHFRNGKLHGEVTQLDEVSGGWDSWYYSEGVLVDR